jgi:hypothetical protein
MQTAVGQERGIIVFLYQRRLRGEIDRNVVSHKGHQSEQCFRVSVLQQKWKTPFIFWTIVLIAKKAECVSYT